LEIKIKNFSSCLIYEKTKDSVEKILRLTANQRFYTNVSSTFFLADIAEHFLEDRTHALQLFLVKNSAMRTPFVVLLLFNPLVFYNNCLAFSFKNKKGVSDNANYLLKDSRFIIYNYLKNSNKFLRLDHFFFFKKKILFSYDKLFLKVDVISFVMLRSNLEYFRAFKYNEYLFNNFRFNNVLLKESLKVFNPSFS